MGSRTGVGHEDAAQQRDPSAEWSGCCCSAFCNGRWLISDCCPRSVFHLQRLQVAEPLQSLFVHTGDLIVVQLQRLDGGGSLEDPPADGAQLVVRQVTAGQVRNGEEGGQSVNGSREDSATATQPKGNSCVVGDKQELTVYANW